MRVLAGYQPSGSFHLGNYFGSIRPILEFQKKSDAVFVMIADMHALTTVHDSDQLRKFLRDAVLDFLACGLDPQKTVLFRQSEVSMHAELAWILSTVAPMGLLERAVSYKDKVEKGIDATVGLFTYPVLQAADILLYDIDVVPVGKDQQQHLEIARDIAIKFNNRFGDVLRVPKAAIPEDVAVVPGTDGQKMSKSYGNTIPIFGDEKIIKKAIMGIVTDSKGPTEPKDPNTSVVYQIHKNFLDEATRWGVAKEYEQGLSYGDAKKKLFETYIDHFQKMREKRAELESNPALVEKIIADGDARARATAQKTMDAVKEAVGLR